MWQKRDIFQVFFEKKRGDQIFPPDVLLLLFLILLLFLSYPSPIFFFSNFKKKKVIRLEFLCVSSSATLVDEVCATYCSNERNVLCVLSFYYFITSDDCAREA